MKIPNNGNNAVFIGKSIFTELREGEGEFRFRSSTINIFIFINLKMYYYILFTHHKILYISTPNLEVFQC